MKTKFWVLYGLLAWGPYHAFAQGSAFSADNFLQEKAKVPGKEIRSVISKKNGGAQSKTTTEIVRLVSITEYTDSVVVDSTSFTYSEERGGTLADGLLYDEAVQYSYDGADLIESRRCAQSFSENVVSAFTEQIWSSQWVDNRRNNPVYGNNGKLTYNLSELHDGSTWNYNSDFSLEYNANDDISESTTRRWNTSDWVNDKHTTYSYSNTLLTSQTLEEWRNGQWVNSTQYVFTYNSDNALTQVQLNVWVPATATWLNRERWTIGYTSSLPTSLLYEVWDVGTSSWLYRTQSIYEHDANGNITQDVQQVYSAGGWVNDRKIDWTYSNGYLTNIVTSTFVSNSWVRTANDRETVFNYESISMKGTGIAASPIAQGSTDLSMSVFPNPAKNILNLNLDVKTSENLNVHIYDITGKIVKEQKVNPGVQSVTIDISNLPSGSFAVHVFGKSSQAVQEVIISK